MSVKLESRFSDNRKKVNFSQKRFEIDITRPIIILVKYNEFEVLQFIAKRIELMTGF